MIGALTGAGITILSTVEVEDTFTELAFSHYAISFLTDDIIRFAMWRSRASCGR